METAVNEPPFTRQERTRLSQQIDSFKKNVDHAAEKAKNNIKTIIDTYSAQADTALHANKRFVEQLRKQMKDMKLNHEAFDQINYSFVNALELSEKVIDTIIDGYTRQVGQLITFNHHCLDMVKGQVLTEQWDMEKFMEVLEKNFEESLQISTHNMKSIVSTYNEHINLAFHFGNRFTKIVNSQMDRLMHLQTRGIDMFNHLVDWWKDEPQKL